MSEAARLVQLSGVVVDHVYTIEAVPAPGEEALVFGHRLCAGGGFNAMVAALRAGLPSVYAGPLGTGPFGDLVRRALEAESIPVLGPTIPDLDQGCCTVLVDAHGERTFIDGEGAEGAHGSEALERLACRADDWTLLSGYSLHYRRSGEAFVHWLGRAPTVGRLVFDPGPLVERLAPSALRAALARALWISANEREAAVLSGCEAPAEAAAWLARGRAASGGAVVRCGANGCHVATAADARGAIPVVHLPGYSVRAIDTNGAGDAHIGYFLAALARGETPKQAARRANVAAALATTREGPATAPSRAAFERAFGNWVEGKGREP